jgi:hypothetical protein
MILMMNEQEAAHIICGLEAMLKMPDEGVGYFATDLGHTKSLSHADLQKLHDRLIWQIQS